MTEARQQEPAVRAISPAAWYKFVLVRRTSFSLPTYTFQSLEYVFFSSLLSIAVAVQVIAKDIVLQVIVKN